MSDLKLVGVVVGVIFVLYVMVAGITFRIRHPWATETETFMNLGKAIKFETVDYSDMRKGEGIN